MDKKQIEKGVRISGKEANAEKYIPLYEFLMFDPIYRQMSDRAKILYCYLRDKTKYFEMQTELYEQGFNGTKSYLDENGDTYILADNSELIYLFNCAESTLVRTKKELRKYGLLEEIHVKEKSNKIYPLKPEKLSGVWEHIEEIKSLRLKQKEKRQKYYYEQKTTNEKKESSSTMDKGNLQNESYSERSFGNLQNESYGNLQNESQIQSNNYKSNLNNNLDTLDTKKDFSNESHISIDKEKNKRDEYFKKAFYSNHDKIPKELADMLKTFSRTTNEAKIYYNIILTAKNNAETFTESVIWLDDDSEILDEIIQNFVRSIRKIKKNPSEFKNPKGYLYNAIYRSLIDKLNLRYRQGILNESDHPLSYNWID